MRSRIFTKRSSPSTSTYAEQTYASPYWIVRYPHRRRYDMAGAIAAEGYPQAVLDFGSGDGEAAKRLLARNPRLTRLHVYEPVDEMADRLTEVLESEPSGVPVRIHRTLHELREFSYDAITCLSVLEHLSLGARYSFYELARACLRREGRLIVEVPVELGPTLLVKASGRMLLKGRQSEYRLRELLARTLGIPVFDPERFDPARTEEWIWAHKGFDYRLCLKELQHSGFHLDRAVSSPIPRLPPWFFNQQIFLVLRHG